MTNKEYILGKLQAFGITEAQLADMEIDLEDTYVPNDPSVGIAMVGLIEEVSLLPTKQSVSEQGFSISWDKKNLSAYYKYLCSKYGVKQNTEVLSLMGANAIIDRTDEW